MSGNVIIESVYLPKDEKTIPPMNSFLIVENYLPLFKCFEQIISKRYKGARIFHAENGEKALIKMRELHCSVIISEIALPLMDGIEFHERLSQESPLLSKRVGFISSNDSTSTLSYLKRMGLPYLVKPANQDEVCRLIDGILLSQEGNHCVKIRCRVERRDERRPVNEKGRIRLIGLGPENVIEGAITDLSGGGFGFWQEERAIPVELKVNVLSEQLNIVNREAEMVWLNRDERGIKSGFQWR